MNAATTITLRRPVVGLSMDAPFEVFLNYAVIANYGDDEDAAEAHYLALVVGRAPTESRGVA